MGVFIVTVMLLGEGGCFKGLDLCCVLSVVFITKKNVCVQNPSELYTKIKILLQVNFLNQLAKEYMEILTCSKLPSTEFEQYRCLFSLTLAG